MAALGNESSEIMKICLVLGTYDVDIFQHAPVDSLCVWQRPACVSSDNIKNNELGFKPTFET